MSAELLVELADHKPKAIPEVAIGEQGTEHRIAELTKGVGIRLDAVNADDDSATVSLERTEAA